MWLGPPLHFISPLFSSETDGQDFSSSSINWHSRSKSTKKRDKRKRNNKRILPKNKSNQRDNSNSSSSPFDSSPATKNSNRICRVLDAARIKPSAHEEHTISKKRLHDDGTRWTNGRHITRVFIPSACKSYHVIDVLRAFKKNTSRLNTGQVRVLWDSETLREKINMKNRSHGRHCKECRISSTHEI